MMINFATLASRAPAGTPSDGGSAAAPGADFAALVQMATGTVSDQATGTAPGGLNLGANAGAAAPISGLPNPAQMDSDLITFVTGQEVALAPVGTAGAPATALPLSAATTSVPAPSTGVITKVGPLDDPSKGQITDMALPQEMAQDKPGAEMLVQDSQSDTAEAGDTVAQAAAPLPLDEAIAVPTGPQAVAPIMTMAQPVVATTARSFATPARTAHLAAPATPSDVTDGAKAAETSDEAEPVEMLAGREATPPTTRTTSSEGQFAPMLQRMNTEGVMPVIQPDGTAAAVRGAGGVQGVSTADALGSQVIDMGVSGQWIDRLAREIAGIADGSGNSRFTLTPPHLGRLQVEIMQGAEAMDVRLITETDDAAQRLNEGRNALHADARVAAINLGQITVEKSSAAFESGPRDQGQSQRDLSSQMQQQENRQSSGRAAQDERDGLNGRGRADRSNQATSDEGANRAAARGTADAHVRFA